MFIPMFKPGALSHLNHDGSREELSGSRDPDHLTQAAICHEIKNNLDVIECSISQVRHLPAATGEAIDATASISEAARNIRMLLDASRSEADEPVATINLVELLLQQISLLEPLAYQNSIQLTFDLPDHPVWISGHARSLGAAILNLLKNALEATRNEDEVRVVVTPFPSIATIRIIDTGIGISSEIRDSLGVPFTTDKPGGTGLGFWIAQKIIRKHNGIISIHSETGEGTSVGISLPLCVPSEPVLTGSY